ncbi:hypothetical protein BKA82DRAFT_4012931 [Pisolithus tinctorius]|nr:hypothetical protein BKA82DRAFT_4012931 [Pisolithus tinctorius]
MLRKAGLGTIRSLAFLAAFMASFQCLLEALHYEVLSSQKTLRLPKSMINFFTYALGGFLGECKRRGKLAMYVLPKAMESPWLTTRGKGWVFRIESAGEALLTAVAMGMVMCTYQAGCNFPSSFRS